MLPARKIPGYITPALADFIEKRFEPWAKARFEKSSPKTWRDYYRVGLLAIKTYKPLAGATLGSITSEAVAAHRQSLGLQVSTVNSSLQVFFKDRVNDEKTTSNRPSW